MDYVKNNFSSEDFLLDSGAFTFMNQKSKKINFEQYIEQYIEFINKYDIKYFFELDVDVIFGHEKVKEIRKYIEQKTNKKTIPVWHKSRGIEEYIKFSKFLNIKSSNYHQHLLIYLIIVYHISSAKANTGYRKKNTVVSCI